MKLVSCTLAALMLAALSMPPAHGHAPLRASNPADGAVVAGDDVPAELELRFGGTLRLTSAVLERLEGERVNLETGRGPAESHRVPLPELSPGTYTVRWRGMAADGHVMSGTIAFTVADR